jgi:hypothetical protein
MSVEGPKPYPVVYDAPTAALQYSFQDGYYTVPVASLNAITSLTGDVTASGPGAAAASLSAARLKEIFVPVSADPGTPTEGQVWYNTTTHAWKGYNGSAVVTFTVA